MSRHARIEARYKGNCSCLPKCDGFLFSQRLPMVEGLAYSEGGHIGGQGCGVVAVYNAMHFIGEHQNLCDVLRDFELLRMARLGARFGTKPHSLGRYFRKHKIPFEKYNAPVDFKAALLTNRIGIVNTWNRRMKGMHIYCVFFSAEDGRYYSINYASGTTGFRPIPLDEISNLRFVTGYVL